MFHHLKQDLASHRSPRIPDLRLGSSRTPNLPTNIIPAKIRRLNKYGEFPTDMRIPPLKIKIMLESNPLKSRNLVRRLAVVMMQCGRARSLPLAVMGALAQTTRPALTADPSTLTEGGAHGRVGHCESAPLAKSARHVRDLCGFTRAGGVSSPNITECFQQVLCHSRPHLLQPRHPTSTPSVFPARLQVCEDGPNDSLGTLAMFSTKSGVSGA